MVVVVVAIILRTDVVHLIDTAAFGATLNGAVAGASQPDDIVRVDRVTGAAEVLLVTERLDYNGVVERSYMRERGQLVSVCGFVEISSCPRVVPLGWKDGEC